MPVVSTSTTAKAHSSSSGEPCASGTRPQRPSGSRRTRGSAPSSATAIRSQITTGASLQTEDLAAEHGGRAAAPSGGRRGPARPACCSGARRARSQGRPPERQRHAARPAAAPRQLRALDRDHGAVLGLAPVVEGQEVDRGDHAEARRPPARTAWRRCGGSSRSCPGAPPGSCRPSSTAPAPGGCGWSPPAKTGSSGRPSSSARGEEVRHLPHPVLSLAAVQHRQPLGSDEVRGVDHAELVVDLAEDHVEMDRRRRLRHARRPGRR